MSGLRSIHGGGGASGTKTLYEATRIWLDATNKVRETRDRIDAARASQAMAALVDVMKTIQTGHLRIHEDAAPLLISLDTTFLLVAHVNRLWSVSRPMAHELARFVRKLEETLRAQLATVTGEEVPARSTSHDAIEDEALSEPAPDGPPSPSRPKLVLS